MASSNFEDLNSSIEAKENESTTGLNLAPRRYIASEGFPNFPVVTSTTNSLINPFVPTEQGFSIFSPYSILHFMRYRSDAFTPTKGTVLSAGFDLHTPDAFCIPGKNIYLIYMFHVLNNVITFIFLLIGGTSSLISLGIGVQVPFGSYGRLAPRSSLSLQGIDVGAGVIDADYRSELKVLLINRGKINYYARRGDRICQLIVTKIQYPVLKEVTEIPLSAGQGRGGFGSTGK